MWMEEKIIGGIIGLLIVGLCVGLYLCIVNENRTEDAFMKECLMYEKQYQCTAKWRAGDKSNTVIPVYMPIRTR